VDTWATSLDDERSINNLAEREDVAERDLPVPGAGHFVVLTREAEVLEEIRKFVASIS
jgi:hypothetical protein